MSYFEAIILGIVQGLGEFLPISSSAHLVVAPWLFGFKDAGLGYSVALHLGTLIAVVTYFWKDWFTIFKGSLLYTTKKSPEHKRAFDLLIYLILATIPAAVFGLLLEDLADATLRQPWIVAITMSALGVLLWIADTKGKEGSDTLKHITLKTALIIGCAQALALIPGVSRSGITITAALFFGFTRSESARFSFLLSTPVIFGACLLKYKEVIGSFTNLEALSGLIAAAVFGFLSIQYLLKLVKKSSYKVFCVYRFLFSGLILVMYLLKF